MNTCDIRPLPTKLPKSGKRCFIEACKAAFKAQQEEDVASTSAGSQAKGNKVSSPKDMEPESSDTDITPPKKRKIKDEDVASTSGFQAKGKNKVSSPKDTEPESSDTDITPPKKRKIKDEDVASTSGSQAKGKNKVSSPKDIEPESSDTDITPPKKRKIKDEDVASTSGSQAKGKNEVSSPKDTEPESSDTDITPPKKRKIKDASSQDTEPESSDTDITPPTNRKIKVTPKKDGGSFRMTKRYFEKNFSSRSIEQQSRGHLQSGESGTFASKTNDQLPWRGMIRRLYRDLPDSKVTCLLCDVAYTNGQSLIKHVERKHKNLSDVEVE